MCKENKTPTEESKEEWKKLRAIESPISINTVDEMLRQSSRCLQAQVEEYRKKMEEKTNA